MFSVGGGRGTPSPIVKADKSKTSPYTLYSVSFVRVVLGVKEYLGVIESFCSKYKNSKYLYKGLGGDRKGNKDDFIPERTERDRRGRD